MTDEFDNVLEVDGRMYSLPASEHEAQHIMRRHFSHLRGNDWNTQFYRLIDGYPARESADAAAFRATQSESIRVYREALDPPRSPVMRESHTAFLKSVNARVAKYLDGPGKRYGKALGT